MVLTRTFLLLIFLGLFGLVPNTIKAQEENNQRLRIVGSHPCDTVENFEGFLRNNHKEIRFAEGFGATQIHDGSVIKGMMVIYVNPQTLTYTVTITNGVLMCMLNSGENFSPSLSKPNADTKSTL